MAILTGSFVVGGSALYVAEKKARAKEHEKQRLMLHYGDTNHDGVLSPTEKAALYERAGATNQLRFDPLSPTQLEKIAQQGIK